MAREMIVVEYNENWHDLYLKEKVILEDILNLHLMIPATIHTTYIFTRKETRI